VDTWDDLLFCKKKKKQKGGMSDVEPMEVEKNVKAERRREALPWVEKYRPTKFDELISHDNILQTRT
jgi:hypothetical protein